jgi:metal-dependent amidase/aminoacylase/carboxypeptidase family protein
VSQVEVLKAKVKDIVESQRRQLIQLSLNIHDNPELGFQEEKASTWLTNYLEDNGFHIEKGIAGLPTAFRATYGQGNPRIALLAEYDALPKVGHACGHNIIAASAVGAGIASKLAIDNFGGSVVVLGTPGEEVFGGKVDIVRADIFQGYISGDRRSHDGASQYTGHGHHTSACLHLLGCRILR